MKLPQGYTAKHIRDGRKQSYGSSKYSYLEQFSDATNLVGQFAQGYEPSFHIPYLYDFTLLEMDDKPNKTWGSSASAAPSSMSPTVGAIAVSASGANRR
jgi:hypothetical protein